MVDTDKEKLLNDRLKEANNKIIDIIQRNGGIIAEGKPVAEPILKAQIEDGTRVLTNILKGEGDPTKATSHQLNHFKNVFTNIFSQSTLKNAGVTHEIAQILADVTKEMDPKRSKLVLDSIDTALVSNKLPTLKEKDALSNADLKGPNATRKTQKQEPKTKNTKEKTASKSQREKITKVFNKVGKEIKENFSKIPDKVNKVQAGVRKQLNKIPDKVDKAQAGVRKQLNKIPGAVDKTKEHLVKTFSKMVPSKIKASFKKNVQPTSQKPKNATKAKTTKKDNSRFYL